MSIIRAEIGTAGPTLSVNGSTIIVLVLVLLHCRSSSTVPLPPAVGLPCPLHRPLPQPLLRPRRPRPPDPPFKFYSSLTVQLPSGPHTLCIFKYCTSVLTERQTILTKQLMSLTCISQVPATLTTAFLLLQGSMWSILTSGWQLSSKMEWQWSTTVITMEDKPSMDKAEVE